MKKNLVSLLLVGALVAPGALVSAQQTHIVEGGTYAEALALAEAEYPGYMSVLQNEDGTYTITYPDTVEDPDPNLTEPVPESWDDERLTITSFESTSAIAFDTERVPNADMFEDEDEVVVTPGADGVLTTTSQIAQWNGNAASWLSGGGTRVLTEVTTEPITQVVEYGTAVRGQEKDTTRIDIPFETKVVENDELPIGTEEVSQEGVNGWYELTTVYETKNGERTEVIKKAEHETDRKDPVNKIIQKGTKEVADEFVVTATLVDEEGNALAGEVLTITGEDVEHELTTDENGAVTFSVPNGTYTVAFGINSKTVVVEDEDISVELVAGPKDVVIPDEFYIGAVLNDFPQFDKEGNEYEVQRLDDFVVVTITDKDGKFVAEIEYNLADNTTRITSIPTIPLEPAKPIEKDEETTEEDTDEEETTDEEEDADEESEVVDVVTADGQTVRVVRTDSRSELPETGELGGATAMMAAALSALGGLGLLFKKRK